MSNKEKFEGFDFAKTHMNKLGKNGVTKLSMKQKEK